MVYSRMRERRINILLYLPKEKYIINVNRNQNEVKKVSTNYNWWVSYTQRAKEKRLESRFS